MKQLRKHAFEGWLKTFGPRQIVGSRAVCRDCPIARYVTARTGAEARVYPHGWSYARSQDKTTPDWARAFIAQVDKVVNRGEAGRKFITARSALKILDSIDA